MAWGKIDDKAYDHAKVEALGELVVPAGWARACKAFPSPILRLAALGLYWPAISWCNRHRTDGFVSERAVVKLTDLPRTEALLIAQALVDVGLWEVVEGGYQVHDYLDFNRSAEELAAEQERKALAGRLGGLARGRQLAKVQARAEQAGKQDASSELSKIQAQGAKPPTRSRPVPSSPPSGGSARAPEIDADDPEWPGIQWLAQHHATLKPTGNGYHQKLVVLVERHGIAKVIATFEELHRTHGDLTTRQYVFGAEEALDVVPKANGRAPVDDTQRELAETSARLERERRERKERAERRAAEARS